MHSTLVEVSAYVCLMGYAVLLAVKVLLVGPYKLPGHRLQGSCKDEMQKSALGFQL